MTKVSRVSLRSADSLLLIKVYLFCTAHSASELEWIFFWNLFEEPLNLVSSALYLLCEGTTVENNRVWNIVRITVDQCVRGGF